MLSQITVTTLALLDWKNTLIIPFVHFDSLFRFRSSKWCSHTILLFRSHLNLSYLHFILTVVFSYLVLHCLEKGLLFLPSLGFCFSCSCIRWSVSIVKIAVLISLCTFVTPLSISGITTFLCSILFGFLFHFIPAEGYNIQYMLFFLSSYQV